MMKLIFKYLITSFLGFLVLVYSIITIRYFIETPPLPPENELSPANSILKDINCNENHLSYIQISELNEDVFFAIPPVNLNLCAETTKESALGKQVLIKYFKNKDDKTYAYHFNYEGLEVFNYQDCQEARSKLTMMLILQTIIFWILLVFVVKKYWRKKHNQSLQRTA